MEESDMLDLELESYTQQIVNLPRNQNVVGTDTFTRPH